MASPPASAATTRSSEVTALAIQVTSWWLTSLRRPVASPPPPRRATRRPSASRPKETGPRFETTMSFSRGGIVEMRLPPAGLVTRGRLRGAPGDDELGPARVVPFETIEEREPVAQEPRHEEVAAHGLPARPGHL